LFATGYALFVPKRKKCGFCHTFQDSVNH
jgi:hypothetical protein